MPDPKKSKPSTAASNFGGERATAPMGVEEDTASAWARFEEVQKAYEAGLDTTAPPSRPQPADPSPGYAATQPMDLAARKAAPAAPAAAPRITLEQLMVLARRNNRACPVPPQWAAFHRLLPARALEGGRSQPAPPPVDGGAWAATSPMQKRLRLRDQLEWAEKAGVLTEAGAFLAALPEQDWHHFDD